MLEVGVFDAKTHFSHLVEQVEDGEEIIITRRGKPVARLVPLSNENSPPHDLKAVFDNMRKLRADVHKREKQLGLPPLTQKDIKAMIEEGRH